MKQTEAQFLQAVIELARLNGWLVAHFRPAINQRGQWMTAVQADGVGFPDLVLVRDRVIFAELKGDKGKTSQAQLEWLASLRYAGAEWYLWYPKDWEEVEKVLKRS